jgi:hypothetical protein
MELGERLVDARELRGVAQVVRWVRLRRQNLVEEVLIDFGGALRLAGLCLVIGQGAESRLDLAVCVDPAGGIVRGLPEQP